MADTQRSSYLQYLPAEFASGDDFVGRFLLAFEQMLTGLGAQAPADFPLGLEEVLEGGADPQGGIQRFFDPGPYDEVNTHRQTPHEFLDWLAGWVALSLRADWSEAEKRRFISRIVPLYRKRGTRAGMIEALQAYTGDKAVTIDEFEELPHYFQVRMTLQREGSDGAATGATLADVYRRRQQIARAIIDHEKPAHTFFAVDFPGIPTMRIGVTSRVGIDTLLGDIPEPFEPAPPRGAAAAPGDAAKP